MAKPRSTVVLEVLTVHSAQVVELSAPFTCSKQKGYDGITYYTFEGIAYGELPFLQKLRENGIAYTSAWTAEGDYQAGSEHCRFHPDGLLQRFEIYDHKINPDLDSLMELIDQPDKLRNFLLVHQASTVPLPWDNQVEYGRIHQARELILA